MTWQPGDSFIRQRCNQCGGGPAEHCEATDEYLCEPCFSFVLESAFTLEDMVENKPLDNH